MSNVYNKYNDSKVYKLQCNDGYYYIGSSVQNINSRLNDHKFHSKYPKHQTTRVYTHINKIGWENVKIVLIGKYNLNNRSELLREEDRYIQKYKNDPFCLNMKINIPSAINGETTLECNEIENSIEYNKYNDSKIYRIYSDEGFYYWGSTIKNVSERFSEHIISSKGIEENSRVHNYFNNIGWENAKIEVVKTLKLNSKKELLEEENKYIHNHINNPLCLNTQHAVLNLENKLAKRKTYNYKYTEMNKTKLNEQHKQYYIKNRDKFIECRHQYCIENTDKVRLCNKNYYDTNKLKRNEYSKQYRELHKEEIQLQRKNYYEKNKFSILQKQAVKIECCCGKSIRKSDLKRHERSIKHQEFIKHQQE